MTFCSKKFELKFVGARFDGGRLPLTHLPDLVAFRELLLSFAKDNWRRLNAERKRLPKGFDKGISLDLVGVKDGSAISQVVWSRDIAQAALPGFTDQLEDVVDLAYTDILSLIDNDEAIDNVAGLSNEKRRALNKLGSSLAPGERIEFVSPNPPNGKVIYIDIHKRRALLTSINGSYVEQIEAIGTLRGVHDSGRLQIEIDAYGELNFEVDPGRVSSDFDGHIGEAIQIEADVKFDRNHNPIVVTATRDVEIIDDEVMKAFERCQARLREIRALPKGWHSGGDEQVDERAAENAERLLRKRPALADKYRFYPDIDGSIFLEFKVAGWDYSVEFGSDGRFEFFGMQIAGGDELKLKIYDDLSEFVSALDSEIKAKFHE